MTIKERKGFTLIEILIVVAIIAILASVILVGLGPTQSLGRDARRVSDLHEVQNGLELYYNSCGYYPGAAACGGTGKVASWAALTTSLTSSSIGITGVPNDPSGRDYVYGVNSGATPPNTVYVLEATLENDSGGPWNGYTPISIPANMGWSTSTAPDCAAKDGSYCISL